MKKTSTTLELSEDKFRIIKSIAEYENRPLSDIYDYLTDFYIERHNETVELLNNPDFLAECKEGLEEIKSGGGKFLDELEG
ncbi:MAG: hypothetical protein HQK91_10840 [Nitrospirae bacterium]|nr:hypothetical protein [Nitrospirota bacterium]